jgi:hypothetical protein
MSTTSGRNVNMFVALSGHGGFPITGRPLTAGASNVIGLWPNHYEFNHTGRFTSQTGIGGHLYSKSGTRTRTNRYHVIQSHPCHSS